MPRRSPPFLPDPRDAEIRRLRDALYVARQAIIGLMPEPLRELLDAKDFCESLDDLDEWERWAVRELMRRADKRPGVEMDDDSPGRIRAYCPLCGGGTQSPHGLGFAVPIGLERHLTGTYGSRRCDVFAAAYEECLDTVRGYENGEPRLAFGPEDAALRVPPWRMPEPAPPGSPMRSGEVIPLRARDAEP